MDCRLGEERTKKAIVVGCGGGVIEVIEMNSWESDLHLAFLFLFYLAHAKFSLSLAVFFVDRRSQIKLTLYFDWHKQICIN